MATKEEIKSLLETEIGPLKMKLSSIEKVTDFSSCHICVFLLLLLLLLLFYRYCDVLQFPNYTQRTSC